MKILTRGEKQVLKRLAAGEELDEFVPGGWWLALDRIDGRIGWNLLRKMALHQEMYTDDAHRIYTINETGRKLLALSDTPTVSASFSH